MRGARLAIGLVGLGARVLVAQPANRLGSQLDAPTRATVQAIVDSARKAGLPADALANKALETAARGADDARIVAAVRSLAAELRAARHALGNSSVGDEVTAGANALYAGVTPADLTLLRQASGRRVLTTPLVVLTDLVSRGVPRPAAASAVISLAKAGLHDADFKVFQRAVGQDIDHGADPAAATSTRARGAMLHSGAPVAPPPR